MRIVKIIAGGVLLAAAGTAQAGVFANGSVSGGFGWRHLDGAQWKAFDSDSQPAFGVLADVRLGQTPLYATLAMQLSVSDFERRDYGVYDGTLALFDVGAGLKLMRTQGLFRPYAGIGVASTGVGVSYEDSNHDDQDDNDQSFGYFVSAGAQFHVMPHFLVGLDARWMLGTETMDLDGVRDDADSFTALLTFGYAWGQP
ncbi:MAG: outer membrane protein [Solimonas sp.]